MIVNNNGCAEGSASMIFLDVGEAVSSRCMEKHPHVSIDEKHRHLGGHQNIIVHLVLSLFLQLQHLTILLLRAVNVLLIG